MGYLITQIIFCLLIAAMLGFIIGWLLKGLSVEKEETNQYVGFGSGDKSSIDDEGALEPVTKAPSISHKVEKIGGIEKGTVRILHKNGINTTKDLIEKCLSRQGLQQVINATEAEESTIKQWVAMADLMRIPDVNGKVAQLVEACGIKSTKALAKVDPQALINEMQNVNQRELIITETSSLPDLEQMIHLIREAKTL